MKVASSSSPLGISSLVSVGIGDQLVLSGSNSDSGIKCTAAFGLKLRTVISLGSKGCNWS